MRSRIIEEDLARILSEPLPWAEFRDRKVLVTGANGFLPAYMVEVLLRLNEQDPGHNTQVYALVRNRELAKKRFADYGGRRDLHFVVQDVCAPLALDVNPDYMIHAASHASPKQFGPDPVGTLLPNVIGTRNLLDAAVRSRVQGFLFLSSGEVYGQIGAAKVPTPERSFGAVDPTDVRSCYAESKRMGETMCVCWYRQHGVPAKIVRPFHTYGPGMRLDDGRVFADFVADIVAHRDIVLKSEGAARRAFCYLADAVAGFFAVLLQGQSGEAYNIGNDQTEISVLELAELLVALFPGKGLKVVRQQRTAGDRYLESGICRNCPDINKARGLGWAPWTSLDEGFVRTVTYYTP